MTHFHHQPTLVDQHNEPSLLPPLPKKIGEYKIESLLNKGGMSLLYLGIHPQIPEPVAVKVLSAKYVASKEMLERFLREAEIIGIANHPNIVKVYGHGRWTDGVYIAMEFIQGISLRQLILQDSMSLKRALEIVLQIGYALTHLHSHGVIHRDLKPENILLTAQGGVKVIDFGISQLYTEKTEARLLGTPVYMSPEQRIDPRNVSFSSDIFSLGLITYELVLGRLSFGQVHLSIIPRGLQKILAKALQPKPEDRYEDIVDFVREITQYLKSEELQKDWRGSDNLGELSENIKEAQRLLVPQELPKWNRLEIAFASNSTLALSTVYYDFFQQSDGLYHVVMGESLTTGIEGLLQVALLKGMVRALAPSMTRPADFVQALNARVHETEQMGTFSFSLLTLNPAMESFSYISCGYTPVWFIPAAVESPRRLNADNPPLGSGANPEMIAVDANFGIGDALFLHTFQAGSSKHSEEVEKGEKEFVEALKEEIYLSPKKQVENVFRKVSREKKTTPITLIGVERLA